jgi:hypothetical protein
MVSPSGTMGGKDSIARVMPGINTSKKIWMSVFNFFMGG